MEVFDPIKNKDNLNKQNILYMHSAYFLPKVNIYFVYLYFSNFAKFPNI